MEKPVSLRFATEEDYKKRNFYNVGTLHRASTVPKMARLEEVRNGTPLSLQNLPFDPAEVAMMESDLVTRRQEQEATKESTTESNKHAG